MHIHSSQKEICDFFRTPNTKNIRTQHNSKYIKHMYTIIRAKLHIHLYIIHSTRNT